MSDLSLAAFLPVAMSSVEAVLGRPFAPPSTQLNRLLDQTLAPLRAQDGGRLDYYPDAAWLDAHLQFLTHLSGWDVLALAAEQTRDFPPVVWRAQSPVQPGFGGGYLRRAHEVRYLAFVYADAALAEQISLCLPPHHSALFAVSSGSDTSLNLLMRADGLRTMPTKQHWYEQHPVALWLHEMTEGQQVATAPWPAWTALTERVRGQDTALHARWRQFVQEQVHGVIRRASAAAPARLGDSHFTDGRHVFHDSLGDDEPARRLEGCDPASFAEHEDQEGVGHYATDTNGLWSWGDRLPCKHPQQFGCLPQDRSFYTDGYYVYSESEVLPEVVASEVRAVPGDDFPSGFLFRDSFFVRYGEWRSWDVDATSFRALGRNFYVDSRHVYERDGAELSIVDGFDPATFRLIEHNDHVYLCDCAKAACARDNNAKPKVFKGANAARFCAVARLPFVTDGKRVWLGDTLCRDLTADKLRVPQIHPDMPTEHGYCGNQDQLRYFLHGDDVFYLDEDRYRILSEADVRSFQVLHVPLARDARHVWHWGELVADAQASGFQWVNLDLSRWTDGAQIFQDGEPLDRRFALEAQVVLEGRSRDLVQLGDMYLLDGDPVQGWSARVQQLAPIACIEDADYYYSWYTHSAGAILVWPKSYTEIPLTHYARVDSAWVLQSPTVESEQRAAERTTVISLEEFQTLFESLPLGSERESVRTQFNDPDASFLRERDVLLLRIEQGEGLSSPYAVQFALGELSESFRPLKTEYLCRVVRASLDRLLSYAPPLSFAILKDLVIRIADAQASAVFEGQLDGQAFELLIQDGTEEGYPCGVWCDLRQGNDAMLRLSVSVDDAGLLTSDCLTGSARLWNTASTDPGFTFVPWSAQLRRQWRQIIAEVLGREPVLRSVEPQWWLDWMDEATAPALSAAEVLQLLQLMAPHLPRAKLRDAAAHVFSEQIGGEADPAQAVWDALMDSLQAHDLLQVFDKQEPRDAQALCNALLDAVGLAARYRQTDQSGGASFYDVVQDFARWLQPYGYLLLWPQGATMSDGDELFPAVIAPAASWSEIQLFTAKLAGRRFDPTIFE